MRSRSTGLLVLLLLALSPAVARAGQTSGDQVYVPEVPGIESVGPQKAAVPHLHPTPHRSVKPKTGEEGTEPTTEPEGEAKTGERHHPAAPAAHEGGNHPPPSSRPPGTSGGKPVGNISPTRAGSTLKTAPSESGGGGGSSPVVPILIAVFVLAAISIGVVLFRERRQAGALEP